MAPYRPGRVSSLTHVQALARGHTDSAIAVLADIMQDGDAPAAARVSAANSLLDRGWGKAAQKVELATPLDRVSDDSLEEMIKSRLLQIVGSSPDEPLPDPPQLRLVGGLDAVDAEYVEE